jgi:site-specific DNA-methyltransferase (adenine-specific)
MRPYYSDDFVTLYHGDCRDVLPSVVADCFITDPPYGVGLTGRTTKHTWRAGAYASYEDTEENVRDICVPVVESLAARGMRGCVTPGVACLQLYPRAADVGCIWLPSGAGCTRWGFSSLIPVLYYGRDPFLERGEGSRPNGMQFVGRSEDVGHPCPKPLRVMSWLVGRVSREGETILDPFAGSGTTLVAAKNGGRKAIGIEIEEAYCEVAAKRLAQGILDLGGAA